MNKWNFKSNTLPLAPQKMKDSGIYLTKYVQIYMRKPTKLCKIKEELINGELLHVHG